MPFWPTSTPPSLAQVVHTLGFFFNIAVFLVPGVIFAYLTRTDPGGLVLAAVMILAELVICVASAVTGFTDPWWEPYMLCVTVYLVLARTPIVNDTWPGIPVVSVPATSKLWNTGLRKSGLVSRCWNVIDISTGAPKSSTAGGNQASKGAVEGGQGGDKK
ncbi:hypothetical protein C8R44DRAFT_977053 [Mycena epipterygia]|nr:hypothetical protein C8R44DRAFT_977053 [Mycena epipterygia]